MRRKILRSVLAAAVLCFVLSVPAFAETGEIMGSDVNLRDGPGLNYPVLFCLEKGETVTVNDLSDEDWVAVDYCGTPCFVWSSYVKVIDSDEEGITLFEDEEETVAEGIPGYINAMYVRFRSGAGSEWSVIREYNKGKELVITGTSGDWTSCFIDGRAGFVFSQYVTETEPEEDEVEDDDVWDESAEAEEEEPVYASGYGLVTVTEKRKPVEVIPEDSDEEPTDSTETFDGYINAKDVCFRTGAGTNYYIIDTYSKFTPLIVTGTSGDWTACIINGEHGYVFSRYVSLAGSSATLSPEMDVPEEGDELVILTETTPSEPETEAPEIDESVYTEGYITGNNVRFRRNPSMTSEIICELFYGNSVMITGYSGSWTAVDYDGESGFVYSDYVSEGSLIKQLIPQSSEESDEGDLGKQIAEYALGYVGSNYVWGGTSPAGFDCSGFVQYVYSQFGYYLNRVAEDQARNGVAVEGELKPGDILCFYSGGGYIGHVGIYLGDGMFVHAQNSATGVVVTPLEGGYSSRGYIARRIV